MLQRFCEALLESTTRRGNESSEVNRRGWQGCAAKLLSQVAQGLDVPDEVVLGGLLIAKRAVDSNLRTSRRFLHRLCC